MKIEILKPDKAPRLFIINIFLVLPESLRALFQSRATKLLEEPKETPSKGGTIELWGNNEKEDESW